MKKLKKNKTIRKPRFISFLGFLFFVIVVFFSLHTYLGSINSYDNQLADSLNITKWERNKLDLAYDNNSSIIIRECKRLNLPPSYFLALSVLESSGKKKPKKRFESKVFNHLKGVRDGKYKSFGSITRKQLKGLSDAALKNLATSWGPFQLMGYQAYELGVYVADIRGKEAIKHGIEWCNKRYGKYLKKKDYKNSFHIHNTGQPLPKSGRPFTHDPKYIPRGLNYILFFEGKLKN